MPPNILRLIERVNKELWLLLSMFAIAGLLNVLADAQRMMLGFYTLPTVVAAYLYGRRHAVLTAYGSVLLALLVTALPTARTGEWMFHQPRQLADLGAWAGTLLVTAYLMGTVCERKNAQVRELRQTYNGILVLLRHFITKDEYTEHHSYRVSEYAVRIGARLDLDDSQIEDVRAAGLLHDIGKNDVSRELLAKAAQFTSGGSLQRVIAVVLAHHDHADGTGHHSTAGDAIPLEARIISVADVYDSLTSDRPYRKAMSPFDAKAIIEKGAGTEFDPRVVDAFLSAFRQGDLEVRLPSIAVAYR
ncbi:MAG TPA: HD domain-containing phosphohydrolase [Vicinamibacterales bacterium]|nr:HD domain-containing phosphohydrolase [Vicinamibacterales bacterium]